MSVDAAGLESDGGHGTELEPGDELAQSGGVGGELTNRVGSIRGGLDTDPVGQVADVDAGSVLVLDRQSGQLGAGFGLASVLFEAALGTTVVVRGRRWGGVRMDERGSGLGRQRLLQGAGLT